MDPLLIGDWVRITERDVVGEPNISVYGIKIYEDGYITKLGIDIPSGRVKEISKKNSTCSKIKNAYKGEMEVEVPRQGLALGHIYTQKYEVSDSALTYILENADGEFFGEINYKRSELGEKILNPVISKSVR